LSSLSSDCIRITLCAQSRFSSCHLSPCRCMAQAMGARVCTTHHKTCTTHHAPHTCTTHHKTGNPPSTRAKHPQPQGMQSPSITTARSFGRRAIPIPHDSTLIQKGMQTLSVMKAPAGVQPPISSTTCISVHFTLPAHLAPLITSHHQYTLQLPSPPTTSTPCSYYHLRSPTPCISHHLPPTTHLNIDDDCASNQGPNVDGQVEPEGVGSAPQGHFLSAPFSLEQAGLPKPAAA